MFSPATKKWSSAARENVASLRGGFNPSPVTPLPSADNPSSTNDAFVPNRPTTGTPAPWSTRLSVLARIPPARKSDEGAQVLDPVQPVYVGEFPQPVRDEQSLLLQKDSPGHASVSGGIDKETSLAWIICGSKLFLWNYLTPTALRNCIVLDLPPIALEHGQFGKNGSNSWLVCIINQGNASLKQGAGGVVQHSSPASILLCNKATRSLVYWPHVYDNVTNYPLVSAAAEELQATPSKSWQHSRYRSSSAKLCSINSMIACAIPSNSNDCIAVASTSNGELWQFFCGPSGIRRKLIFQSTPNVSNQDNDNTHLAASKGYPRSLNWRPLCHSSDKARKQFLLLTDHEIQCFALDLFSDFGIKKLWSHEIVGSGGEGIKKDLAGQKQIWPLDLQVDSAGRVITILIAIFCKDRTTSSSYTQYSLLTMQYKSGTYAEDKGEKILEKKAPVQEIIPKARVEDEEILFSMRLKVGGRPAGSVVILSGDGTATVSHYWRNSPRLYQFDLPYDAGKVLDASVFPSSDDDEDGAWAVLTEKAGVWAIPERAVLLGGVEPPERSLSRKGSSNDGPLREDKGYFLSAGKIAPRRASSEAWDAGDKQRAGLTGIARRNAQDEESEALLNQLLHDFLIFGQVDDALDKLNNVNAFEREGEMNVFTRMSKSIVDTLAKHWTTTRGPEIVALTVLSTQLIEKQQKHNKFLQFLALSKCHEELRSRQKQSLQIIMEHGEKLAGMIQLRELQNMISEASTKGMATYTGKDAQISGALWDLIRLVGEKVRRKTVLLMDRDNAEVFYSKVSDIEEMFHCLERQLEYVINGEMPFIIQLERARELSSACVTVFHAAMQYKDEYHLWYPPPEGLTPWYSRAAVRNGLWSIAAFMLQLLRETHRLDDSIKFDFYSHLEGVSEVLLEAYSNATTAKVECKEEHSNLLDEYWKRRDVILDSLYQHLKNSLLGKLKFQESAEENEESEEILKRLSSRLLSIAKRHEGHQTLWNICHDYNDPELLRNLMRDSMGPKVGFSYFVFKQLYESKQFSKLMRLGEEFQYDLATFVKEHPDLRWLHEVFLHQFSSASETLHVLSLSQNDSSMGAIDELESCGSKAKLKLSDRKRLLNLSKIAMMAGKDVDYVSKLKRIEADLNILKVQEEILEGFPDNEDKQFIEQRLLAPVELIELCLKSQKPDLSLRAFDLFAWTSSSFLKGNISLLEECWRNAANQDDWERLYERSLTEGWSDEETLRVLRETVLFKASRKCYGPEAETFEGRFEEVLPLRQENAEHPNPKDAGLSVEGILKQHKDFPDAGKLMLSAVMLGVDGNGVATDMDEGP